MWRDGGRDKSGITCRKSYRITHWAYDEAIADVSVTRQTTKTGNIAWQRVEHLVILGGLASVGCDVDDHDNLGTEVGNPGRGESGTGPVMQQLH